MRTLEPRFWNCVRTNRPAPWPIDTMVVTAAMPMTTPRTVSPERNLFLPSVRNEIIKRSNRSTRISRGTRVVRRQESEARMQSRSLLSSDFCRLSSKCLPGAERTFHANDDRLVFDKIAFDQFRELVFDQPQSNWNGAQQLAVLHPNKTALPFLRQ